MAVTVVLVVGRGGREWLPRRLFGYVPTGTRRIPPPTQAFSLRFHGSPEAHVTTVPMCHERTPVLR
jgi:hypothetical protein